MKPSLLSVAIIHSTEGLHLPLLLLACQLELGHQSSPAPLLGFTSLALLVLETSDLDWNYATCFPGSPAYR